MIRHKNVTKKRYNQIKKKKSNVQNYVIKGNSKKNNNTIKCDISLNNNESKARNYEFICEHVQVLYHFIHATNKCIRVQCSVQQTHFVWFKLESRAHDNGEQGRKCSIGACFVVINDLDS